MSESNSEKIVSFIVTMIRLIKLYKHQIFEPLKSLGDGGQNLPG